MIQDYNYDGKKVVFRERAVGEFGLVFGRGESSRAGYCVPARKKINLVKDAFFRENLIQHGTAAEESAFCPKVNGYDILFLRLVVFPQSWQGGLTSIPGKLLLTQR